MSKRSMFSNIFWYLQGNGRYKLCNTRILKYLVPAYIRDQIATRERSVNAICDSLGSCKECGCSIPHLQYADTECHGWCYPPMLDRNTYILLKNGGCYEDKINKVVWRIENGKFHYTTLSRNNPREEDSKR